MPLSPTRQQMQNAEDLICERIFIAQLIQLSKQEETVTVAAATTTTDLAVAKIQAELDAVAPKRFDMDRHISLVDEYDNRRRRMAEDEQWCDDFEKIIQKMGDGAEAFYVRGRRYATWKKTGKLVVSRLAAEQPHIIAEFTHLKSVEEFDQEAFVQQHPDLYQEYRAPRWVLDRSNSI